MQVNLKLLWEENSRTQASVRFIEGVRLIQVSLYCNSFLTTRRTF